MEHIRYKKETEVVTFQGKEITLENLSPVFTPEQEAAKRRELEQQLYEVFRKYADKRQSEELLYTGSSFSLWKVTKIIFLFHQNYFSRKKFCGYRFRLHVLLLKLSTVSINSLLRRVEFIDFCGWFLHASFLSDHFFRVIHMKK